MHSVRSAFADYDVATAYAAAVFRLAPQLPLRAAATSDAEYIDAVRQAFDYDQSLGAARAQLTLVSHWPTTGPTPLDVARVLRDETRIVDEPLEPVVAYFEAWLRTTPRGNVAWREQRANAIEALAAAAGAGASALVVDMIELRSVPITQEAVEAAVRNGHAAVVRELLERQPQALATANANDLFVAALTRGAVEVVAMYLERGLPFEFPAWPKGLVGRRGAVDRGDALVGEVLDSQLRERYEQVQRFVRAAISTRRQEELLRLLHRSGARILLREDANNVLALPTLISASVDILFDVYSLDKSIIALDTISRRLKSMATPYATTWNVLRRYMDNDGVSGVDSTLTRRIVKLGEKDTFASLRASGVDVQSLFAKAHPFDGDIYIFDHKFKYSIKYELSSVYFTFDNTESITRERIDYALFAVARENAYDVFTWLYARLRSEQEKRLLKTVVLSDNFRFFFELNNKIFCWSWSVRVIRHRSSNSARVCCRDETIFSIRCRNACFPRRQ